MKKLLTTLLILTLTNISHAGMLGDYFKDSKLLTSYDYSQAFNTTHRVSTKMMFNEPNVGLISMDSSIISFAEPKTQTEKKDIPSTRMFLV